VAAERDTTSGLEVSDRRPAEVVKDPTGHASHDARERGMQPSTFDSRGREV